MATEVKMPQLSDTMDSGKILSWNKQEGDSVSRGDILAEVETDKANLEIESFNQGTLLKIVVPENESADVGSIIAYIGEAGEEVPSNGNGASATVKEAAPEETGADQESKEQASAPVEKAAQENRPEAVAEKQQASASPASQNGNGRVKASPLARKIAEQKNIALSEVQGSGPDGRIVKRDLENLPASQERSSEPRTAVAEQSPTPAASPAPGTRPASGDIPGNLVPMSKVRETIARRMQQTVVDSPHFFVSASVDMGEALKLRALLKEEEDFTGISVNHLILKAAAYAIRKEPRVNYAVREETMVFEPAEINLGIITALDDGLLIPVVRQADRLSLKDLVFEARAAVERARAGRPSSSDLLGGTFSISNMGMFDVESFTALINPGQGSVLAVSSVQEVPVVKNGQIVPGKIMKVTISVDHRIIDGVMAGNFLKAFRTALEQPALLMI